MYEYDKRVVLTLDAGGTNFVFSAIQGNNEMISPIGLPAVSDNLDECLEVLVKGFDRVIAAIPVPPVAISFAFPGPADYENGIIGDLPNFPSFRGGVALGPFLKHKYGIPVFIENDGNLFAYGEALSGALPMINRELSLAGCSREYKNLIGPTLQVCEFTLQFVLGNSPPANLISYKYESGILLGKFVEFFFDGFQ